MAKQIRGTSTKAIKEWELEVSRLVRTMQNLQNEGKSAEQIQSKLGSRFKELKNQADKLTVTTKYYASITKSSAKATANLKTRLDKLNTGVTKLSSNEKKLEAAIRKDTDAKKKNAKASGSAAKENKALADSAKNAGGRFGKFTKGVGNALKTLSRFATAGAIAGAAVKAFRFVVVDSVKAFVEFDDAVKNLSAVAGVTGNNLDRLTKSALDVAGQTRFTAIEIVKLQTELSKLGFSALSVEKATSSIAFAAQALGAPIGTTAEQVGKLTNQFKLLAEDSDEIADILVTTINNSALSLDSFSTAVQYIGPIASDLGLSLQQTAGAMAVLSDNGFTASRVGTGLRAIFTKLGATTVDVESKLKELAKQNLSVADASELVGVRNASQLITLLSNIEAIEEGNDKYYQMGQAMKAAATQTTSVSGQLAILKSEVNRTQISIGEFIANTDVLSFAIGLVDQDARKTIESFKILNEMSTEDLQDDMKALAEGADAQELALKRLAEAEGKTVDEFVKGEAKKSFWVNKAVQALAQQFGVLGTIYNVYTRITGGVITKQQAQIEGVTEAYEKQFELIQDNLLIQAQRQDVEDQYESTLQSLITKELEGIDVQKEAADMADEIQKKRLSIRKAIEAEEERLKNNTSLTEEQREAVEDVVMQWKAKEKALSNYQRRFSNFIKDYAEESDIQRRRARNFKDEIDALEDQKDKIKERYDVVKLANEEDKRWIDNTDALVTQNSDLLEKNETFIQQMKDKKAEILGLVDAEQKNVDAEGKLTKQANANISTYTTELTTLDNIIRKYEEKNEKLGANTNFLRTAQANFEKQQADLLKEYSDEEGFIKDQEAYIAASAALLDQYYAQLEVAAKNNPELKKAIDAIRGNIVTEIGEQGFAEFPPIDWNQILADGIDEAIDVVSESLEGFNDTAFKNTKARLESEKEALKDRYETEDYLAKQQFENGLINEAQYRRRQNQLRKKQVAEENAIEKQLFEAERKKDRNDAKVDYLEALASIIPALITRDKEANPVKLAVKSAITAGLATAAFGAEMSAINQRKFFPKKFEQGGMVEGPSHAQGGVPFTVQGQSGYEMEGGEFIVNKRAASLHRDLLEKINGSVKVSATPEPMKFANGGVVNKTTTTILKDSSESVDYLKVIAQATAQAAMNSNKPVRAFVTSNDLRNDETARRIKDNNTII